MACHRERGGARVRTKRWQECLTNRIFTASIIARIRARVALVLDFHNTAGTICSVQDPRYLGARPRLGREAEVESSQPECPQSCRKWNYRLWEDRPESWRARQDYSAAARLRHLRASRSDSERVRAFVDPPVPPPLLRRYERIGAPGRTRTCCLKIRSLALYPDELRARAALANSALSRGHKPR